MARIEAFNPMYYSRAVIVLVHYFLHFYSGVHKNGLFVGFLGQNRAENFSKIFIFIIDVRLQT